MERFCAAPPRPDCGARGGEAAVGDGDGVTPARSPPLRADVVIRAEIVDHPDAPATGRWLASYGDVAA